MPVFDTSRLGEKGNQGLSEDQTSWVYNGLDCCVTSEVFDRLSEEMAGESPEVQYTYAMALAKQAPYLEMSMRGIKINEGSRQESLRMLENILDNLERRFQRLMFEVFDHKLNWRSPAQLKTFFYGELGIKEIKKRNQKGQYVATVDEDALNRLEMHSFAQPYAKYILAMREIGKKATFLKTQIDRDGRIRCNINVAGTNTGRLSSSANDFGTGTNLQNVDRTLRTPFVADPHMILVECDLEQADARNVGAIIWNRYLDSHGAEAAGAYLDACESGDLHTTVAKMCFPDLGWSENRSGWRSTADLPFIKGDSYRDSCKKLGHGTNYYGQPATMARNTGIPSGVVKDFQYRYFEAYPLIQNWQHDTIDDVEQLGYLITPFGRRRHFFGRGNDKSTHREAIAYSPQSMTGHEMDMGILNLWRNSYPAQWATAEKQMHRITEAMKEMIPVELLMQVHDSILFEVPFHNRQTHIERALAALHYRTKLRGGREFCVPLGAKVGWNWGGAGRDGANPFGLKGWKGSDDRQPPATKRLADYMR